MYKEIHKQRDLIILKIMLSTEQDFGFLRRYTIDTQKIDT